MNRKGPYCSRTTQTTAKKFRDAIRGFGLVAAIAGGFLSMSGCTRQKYRSKTDTEAYYLLDEKREQSCETNAEVIRIELDPRSRMFDPFNPDRPPMPEDDPQANRFMRSVDGKKGYPLWEGNGRTNLVENPQWWNYLPLDERGVLVLTLDDAVRVALLHSPSYQQNLETMYLSALDVSVERFRFDSQFYGGSGANYRRVGQVASNNPLGSTVASIGSNRASMSKLYSTGTTLVADVANSLTWQIAGPDNFTTPSLLNFAIFQPLLRGGGRDVILERLTIAERALLTNVRAFERYRRGFYVEIATGVSADARPSRQGGAFGGAGLGSFDALGTVFNSAVGGGGGFGGNTVQNANGFIGLLQDQLNIANQKETILRLEDIYLQYADSYRELLLTMPENQTEIPQQQLQVAQAQQSVYDAQSGLLNLQAAYEQTLDSFKTTLGLPPYLCVEIKGDLLDPFQLISIDLRERRAQMNQFRGAVGKSNSALLQASGTERDPVTGESYRIIESSNQLVQGLDNLKQNIRPIFDVLNFILEEDVAVVHDDIQKLRDAIPVRRRQLSRLKDIAERERAMVCSLLPLGDFDTTFLDAEGLEELPDELIQELDVLVERVRSQTTELNQIIQGIETTAASLNDFQSARDRFSYISENILLAAQGLIAAINENVLAIQLVQARARTESVVLPEIDLEPRDALEIARQNRRDWLIRKAAVVDTWRRIEFVADDLESVLNLTLTGGVGNLGSSTNPFAFHASTGNLRAGLVWDAPITRVQERNNYRQILIQFQQARRAYYQYEDGIWASLRASLRQVRQSELRFEIQRFAVQNAALQIMVNEDIRQINETLGQSSGVTAARDSVQGIQAFLQSQSDLIGIYATFESRRRVLDRDLGTMEIDSEGLWIDPGPLNLSTVGGGLGQAIAEYGLAEGEMLTPEEVPLFNDGSLEIIPSSQMPLMPNSQGSSRSRSPLLNGPVPASTETSAVYNAEEEALYFAGATVSSQRPWETSDRPSTVTQTLPEVTNLAGYNRYSTGGQANPVAAHRAAPGTKAYAEQVQLASGSRNDAGVTSAGMSPNWDRNSALGLPQVLQDPGFSQPASNFLNPTVPGR